MSQLRGRMRFLDITLFCKECGWIGMDGDTEESGILGVLICPMCGSPIRKKSILRHPYPDIYDRHG